MAALRAVGNVAGFVVAFAICVAILSPFRALPDRTYLRAKFEHWREHAADYDVVVLGSSRVLRAFDPTVFDAATAARGTTTRSFNFGVPGMRGHEADAVLRRLLAADRGTLRHVLLEFPDYTGGFPDANAAESDRAVWWHDATGTLDVISTVLRSEDESWIRLRDIALHARLAVANRVNYGALSAVLESRFVRKDRTDATAAAMLALHGFAPIPFDREPIGETERTFAARGADVVEEAAPRIARRHAIEDRFAEFNADALARRLESLAERGIVATHFTVPTTTPQPLAYRCRERALAPRLLLLNDLAAYADLYRTTLFTDGAHLNDRGAREFSAKLASAFLALDER